MTGSPTVEVVGNPDRRATRPQTDELRRFYMLHEAERRNRI